MPVVTYPNPLFATSTAVSSTAFKDFFCVSKNNDSDDTLETINGDLDYLNLDSTFVCAREHTQPGSSVIMKTASGSLNLDYFSDVWSEDGTDDARAIPLLGASRRFWLPWEGLVMFSWQYLWTTTQENNTDIWLTVLKIDDEIIGPTRREHARSLDVSGVHGGLHAQRFVSGHWAESTMTEGWHDVGIYVFQKQTTSDKSAAHFWCRNLNVVAWKFPTS